jgi:hypothetical protein
MGWWRRLSRNAKIYILAIGGFVSTFLVLIVSAVFNGIVGNRADAGFVHFWEWAKDDKTIAFQVWPSIFLILIILVVLLIAIYLFRLQFNLKIKELKKALNISTKLNGLDSSILLLLSRLKQNQSKESTAKLLNQFLSKIRESIPGVCSVWLCLPDDQDKNYLRLCHAEPEVSSQLKERAKFYIGDDEPSIKRGLAGAAYHKWKIQVNSFPIHKESECREPSHPEYIIFGNPKATAHKTTAAVVVIDDDDHRLGVMCVDSYEAKIFDSKEMEDLLKEISRRLARILVISKI